MKIKIGLFDNLFCVLDWMKSSIGAYEEFEIVWMAQNSQTALKLLAENPVDILIADVITNEEIGLEFFYEVYSHFATTKVITFSSITDTEIIEFLKAYGVCFVINKNNKVDVLISAIFEAANLKIENRTNVVLPPKLTPKELAIVKLLAKGLASKEIADFTHNSVHTINNQKNSLLNKFKCSNSTELILKLSRIGYVNKV